jgi:FixJ family two-component response regulator
MAKSEGSGPAPEEPVVLVVEDDETVRRSTESLLRSAGYTSRTFASAADLLDAEMPDVVSCLVMDVRLPRLSGLDLHAELIRRGRRIPVIFMTGHGDIPMSVRAMKAGAIDFLAKPFRDQDLLDAVSTALNEARAQRETEAGLAELRARHASLTTREREVLTGVAAGRLNKQIAGDLGLSEITIKLHRSTLMRKMQARTLAHLLQMVEALERNSLRP